MDPYQPDDETTDAGPRARASRGDPLIGKVLDQRYRIVSLVAKGGMGRVYRAEQAPLGRVVAVKVLDVGIEQDEDQEFRRRFVKEAETCARLSHPNTVRVFDYGKTWDGVLFIAMEYLEGRNLFQAIQTDAPMAPIRVVRIARQIASSLREAHALGLIHRDLKPSNVILTEFGGEEHVKVVDFGLAKEINSDADLTRGDALVGSPSYMSPEQVRSAALDARSDVYSLGVLLYACLTGRPPFTGSTSLNVLMGHLNQAPPPMDKVCPSMPRAPELEALVMRMLAKAPADRYPDMDAVLEGLAMCEEVLRESSSSRMQGPRSRPPEEPRRSPEARPSSPRNASGTHGSRPQVTLANAPSEPSLVMPRQGTSVVLGVGVVVALLFAASGVGLGLLWWFTRDVPADPPVTVEQAPPTDAPVPAPPTATTTPTVTTPTTPPVTTPTTSAVETPATPAADHPSAPRTVNRPRASTTEAPPPRTEPAATTPTTTPSTPPDPPPADPPRRTSSDVRDPWEKR